MRYGLLAVLLIAAQFGSAWGATDSDAALRDLDAEVTRDMQQWGVPGLAIALMRDDKIVALKGYGVRTLGGPEKVTERTVFAIASVTKSFTAATLAMLVDARKMNWDDPVSQYLPTLALYDPVVTSSLTIRDLLAHRVCVQDRNLLTWNSPYNHEEIIRRMRFLKPACSFRDRFEYSNLNFMLAGDVAAAVSGHSWQELVQKNIFEPLGMTSSTTSTSAARKSENLATPYIKIDGKLQPLPLFDEGVTEAAGAIHSTVEDMSKWLKVQMDEGTFEGHQLWSADAAKAMHAAQMAVRYGPPYTLVWPNADFVGYGFGWYIHDFAGHKVVEHDGQSDGMHSLVSMMPGAKLGIVVLTNTSMIGLPTALANTWYERSLGMPAHDWSSLLLASLKPLNDSIDTAAVTRDFPHIRGTHPSLGTAGYVGQYEDSLLGDARVRQDARRGLAIDLLGRSGELRHWHYDTFRVDWHDDLYLSLSVPFVTFKLDAAGKAKSLDLSADDHFIRVGRDDTPVH